LPLGIGRGCNNSRGTFGMFSTDSNLKIQQPLSQFFVSQLINLEWVQMGTAENKLFPTSSDVMDDAGHTLVTAYAALRPDGQWSLLIINKDQENPHTVRIAFHDSKSNADDFFCWPGKRRNLRQRSIPVASQSQGWHRRPRRPHRALHHHPRARRHIPAPESLRNRPARKNRRPSAHAHAPTAQTKKEFKFELA
jgi:hypothetical protein